MMMAEEAALILL